MTRSSVARPMRRLAVALVLLAPLLAGCAAPTEDKADPLFGLCPQWRQGPGQYNTGLHLSGNQTETRELGPANATDQGQALDLYRIRLDRLAVDGRLEMRAVAANGQALNVRDYRQAPSQLVPYLSFTDGAAAGHEFDVFLSSVTHAAPSAPGPVTLKWSGSGESSAELTVTFHYKVCGN